MQIAGSLIFSTDLKFGYFLVRRNVRLMANT